MHISAQNVFHIDGKQLFCRRLNKDSHPVMISDQMSQKLIPQKYTALKYLPHSGDQ